MVNTIKGQLGFNNLHNNKKNIADTNRNKANVSFSAQNPFMTDTFELSTKSVVNKSGLKTSQKLSFSELVNFLGSKIDTAVLKTQILSTGKYNEKDAENILKSVTPDNKDLVGFLVDESQTGRAFYSFSIQNMLSQVNAGNKEVLKDLVLIKYASEDKCLNDSGIKEVLKYTKANNIEVLKALIDKESGLLDSRMLFSSDISSLLKSATSENAQVIVDLIKEKNSDGSFKYNRSNLSMLAIKAKGSDSGLLQTLQSVKNTDGRPKFSDKNINSIIANDREDKKELLVKLIDISVLSGDQIETVIRTFKQPAIDYLFANKDNQYRRDVLFALNPFFKEAPAIKIIESDNLNGFSNVEKQQLAKLLCKKEYKNICNQLKDINVPLLPKMSQRTAVIADLLAQLKQNQTLPRLSDHNMWIFNENLANMDNGNDIEMNIHNLNVLFSTDFRSTIQPLRALVADPNFQNLNTEDKKNVKLAVLLQNRADNSLEASHEAKAFLTQLDLSAGETYKVVKLISNKDWLNDLTEARVDIKQIATSCFMKPGMFELTKLMTAANLKADNNEAALKRMKKASKAFEPIVENIISTAISLPETKIPKASELHLPYEELGNNDKTKNKIIRLNDNTNFEEIGFAKGTNRDNLYMLVHAINEHIDQLQLEELQVPVARFDVRDTINYVNYSDKTGDGLFSTSLISPENNNLFINQRYAFVFNTDEDNVAVASQKDIWSGYDKNDDLFTSHVMRPNRSYFADSVKEELQKLIGDESTVKDVYKEMIGFNALTDLSPERANAVKQAVDAKLMNNQEHNEIIVRAPKVQAVLVKNATLDEMPFELRQFAERYDLPIIYINNKF